jgi:putative tricarboxylic transport membrane protein
MIRIRDPKNFACALLFVGFAALLAGSALSLPLGSASEMGPGYFPLILAIILACLGLALAVASLRRDGDAPKIQWRGVSLITLSILAFAASIRWLGFLPAASLCVVVATLADRGFPARKAVLLTIVLVAACWLIFVKGLGMPVPLFGR